MRELTRELYLGGLDSKRDATETSANSFCHVWKAAIAVSHRFDGLTESALILRVVMVVKVD